MRHLFIHTDECVRMVPVEDGSIEEMEARQRIEEMERLYREYGEIPSFQEEREIQEKRRTEKKRKTAARFRGRSGYGFHFEAQFRRDAERYPILLEGSDLDPDPDISPHRFQPIGSKRRGLREKGAGESCYLWGIRGGFHSWGERERTTR